MSYYWKLSSIVNTDHPGIYMLNVRPNPNNRDLNFTLYNRRGRIITGRFLIGRERQKDENKSQILDQLVHFFLSKKSNQSSKDIFTFDIFVSRRYIAHVFF